MSKSLLADYVKTYAGFLSPQTCSDLIDLFESSPHQVVRRADNGYSFTQLNVSEHWPEIHDEISRKLSVVFYKYQSELDVRRFWPQRYFYEHIRIQRYKPDGRDCFPTHVDAFNNQASARFMTAIAYLNEPDGGETVFPDLDISIKPETGKLLVFPPLWPFPHAGLPPRSVGKYILHTYILYPPP